PLGNQIGGCGRCGSPIVCTSLEPKEKRKAFESISPKRHGQRGFINSAELKIFCSGYKDADNIWQTGFSCGWRDLTFGKVSGLSCCQFANGTRYCCYTTETPLASKDYSTSNDLETSSTEPHHQQQLENMKLTLIATAVTSCLLLVLLLSAAVTLALRARKNGNSHRGRAVDGKQQTVCALQPGQTRIMDRLAVCTTTSKRPYVL
uniref:Activin_recp domain-containing protein n=1 Tax=Macrostomum lignano TaxID=282301 RepID=A0A1I8IR06_9PLAT